MGKIINMDAIFIFIAGSFVILWVLIMPSFLLIDAIYGAIKGDYSKPLIPLISDNFMAVFEPTLKDEPNWQRAVFIIHIQLAIISTVIHIVN